MMREQYDFFIKTQQHLLDYKINEIHELYDKANNLYSLISKSKDYLKFIGFSYDKIEKLNNREELYYYDYKPGNFHESAEIMQLKANVFTYTNILVNKIPELEKDIEFIGNLAIIPYEAFIDLYAALNNTISETLLEGDPYYFPKGIGGIQIFNFNRDFNKKVVDYGRSNELKKQGFEKYIVFHLDDVYTAPKYMKKTATVPNYKYYNFKFTRFINTPSRSRKEYYKQKHSKQDILKDVKIGNWDKMLALINLKSKQIYTDYGDRLPKWKTYYK